MVCIEEAGRNRVLWMSRFQGVRIFANPKNAQKFCESKLLWPTRDCSFHTLNGGFVPGILCQEYRRHEMMEAATDETRNGSAKMQNFGRFAASNYHRTNEDSSDKRMSMPRDDVQVISCIKWIFDGRGDSFGRPSKVLGAQHTASKRRENFDNAVKCSRQEQQSLLASSGYDAKARLNSDAYSQMAPPQATARLQLGHLSNTTTTKTTKCDDKLRENIAIRLACINSDFVADNNTSAHKQQVSCLEDDRVNDTST